MREVGVGFGGLFRRATIDDPFAYQERLAVEAELPALLRAPTGAGKTAAAVLGWLYRRRFHPEPEVRRTTPRRLVYCLPMRVLVEQTLAAVRRWIAELDLAGQVGVYQLMGGALEDDWVRHPEREAVLVGTMDMLLSRAMNRGYAAARSRWPLEFGLLNNDCLWVLDEVQLMGNGLAASAQLAAFRALFGTARPSPSMWMSATVDREWLRTVDHEPPDGELSLGPDDLAGPLGNRVRAPKTLRRLDVAGWPKGGAEAVLDDLHRPGTLTLVVVNTVERARRLHRALERRAPAGLEVRLLHSRFRPPDRQLAMEAVVRPPQGAGRIVVATQVVEAGVDLSAATLITELAPWGSLVQRFGRCNRYGELAEATVAWVDLRSDKEAKPYEAEELEEARQRLAGLEGGSVSPAALEALGPGLPPRVRHVLRRHDLLDLFDTEPDLAGNDVDVSRFIRDDADADVHVFWRQWTEDEPPADLRRPAAEELCPVPVWEVKEFLRSGPGQRGRRAFVWDHLQRQWRPLAPEELRPGMTVLLPTEAGGYAPDLGWDRDAPGPVQPLGPAAQASEPEEAMDDEPTEEVAGAWVPLAHHLGHVRDRVADLLGALNLDLEEWVREALLTAALWHDVGKAHRVFQEAVLKTAPEAEQEARRGVLWAKSAHAGVRLQYERRYFRHELASALALLQVPPRYHGLEGRVLDLAAYLAAAHHGKVRLAIRALRDEHRPPEPDWRFARGIWDGDELGPVPFDGSDVPKLGLDLSVMEVGRGPGGRPSWAERMLRVRDALGPFRLAFLEALLRVADWQVSAEEGLGHNEQAGVGGPMADPEARQEGSHA